MTPEAVFKLAGTLVLPQWLLMIFAPRWIITKWIVNSCLISVFMGVIYIIYLFGGGMIDFGAFGTLPGVKNLFTNGGDGVMLAGWVHYLAFDLLAATFLLRDSQEKGIPHLLIVIPLFFCFMLGPIGFLLYWIIRLIRTRSVLT